MKWWTSGKVFFSKQLYFINNLGGKVYERGCLPLQYKSLPFCEKSTLSTHITQHNNITRSRVEIQLLIAFSSQPTPCAKFLCLFVIIRRKLWHGSIKSSVVRIHLACEKKQNEEHLSYQLTPLSLSLPLQSTGKAFVWLDKCEHIFKTKFFVNQE